VRGGSLTVPAPPAAIGERRRIRVIAGDVSHTREAPGPSSILNVLPARIVSMKAVDSNGTVVVVALGVDGAGARLLSRVTRKSWETLGLAEGVSVYAQVKGRARAAAGGLGVSGMAIPRLDRYDRANIVARIQRSRFLTAFRASQPRSPA
jgi:molybdate transport system ATP-binding protein